jgi:hypothetical protein
MGYLSAAPPRFSAARGSGGEVKGQPIPRERQREHRTGIGAPEAGRVYWPPPQCYDCSTGRGTPHCDAAFTPRIFPSPGAGCKGGCRNVASGQGSRPPPSKSANPLMSVTAISAICRRIALARYVWPVASR